jgi:hypothetical protein
MRIEMMRAQLVLYLLLFACGFARADVAIVRVPDGGIEPQAAIDTAGMIHLIYFKGPDGKGDVFYTTTTDGKSFAEAVRVNSQAGSAMAIGAVRGAQLALGRNGRVHVAWMGSNTAEPKAPGNATPMLYARSDSKGGFEPQRNVISKYVGLDGGGSIAADGDGHVYIAWHAPATPKAGEADRHVWITRSINDGATFAPEELAAGQGVCACCSLRIIAAENGKVFGLFRQAKEKVNRGTVFFGSGFVNKFAFEDELAPAHSSSCIMSTFALAETKDHHVVAYETAGEIFLELIPKVGVRRPVVTSVGQGKHPSISINAAGEILVARAVGTSWGKGGSIAYQVFDAAGKAIEGQSGEAKDLPVWSYPTAVARADGSFVAIY